VATALATRTFQGEVHSVFDRACNLVDQHQEIITLALPELENGPFFILVDSASAFTQLQPGQPVLGDQKRLEVGPWEIDLAQSKIWDPRLPAPGACPFKISSTTAAVIAPYSSWSVSANSLWTGRMAVTFNRATQKLVQAIRIGADVAETARPLAGLGPGLTPAGDDYLLGVMAALWLVGKGELTQEIARAASPRTTLLSGAFLRAAGSGSFAEGWRRLVEALLQGKEQATAEACEKLSRWGATSGRDALAGFALTLLNVA
jgi:hypothetical protein